MRLMEVGTKKLNEGNSQSAKDLFDKSYTLWNIFWGLNLELIEVKDINSYTNSESEEKIIFQNDNDPNKDKAGSLNVWNKLGDMLKKILDCCKE